MYAHGLYFVNYILMTIITIVTTSYKKLTGPPVLPGRPGSPLRPASPGPPLSPGGPCIPGGPLNKNNLL